MIRYLFIAAALCSCQDLPTFGTTVVVPGGLEGVIYHIPKNSKEIPDLRKIKPQGKIYTSALNVTSRSFKEGFPGVTKRLEWFALEYTGRFWIEKPALYGFSLTSDDGSRLFIDDQPIVDNDGQHPPTKKSGVVELSGGIHSIRVQYFQGPRFDVALVLEVAIPYEEVRVFSTDEFKPPANPEDWRFPGKK